jgi:uncharacterized protein (DUF427 family)
MAVAASSPQVHIRPAPGTWSVRAGGALIARSTRALEMIEGSRPPVLYFPRDDVATDLLDRTATVTTCPLKGAAAHFAIVTPAGRIEDAAWSYETPRQHVGTIAGHLAFYPERATLTVDLS